MSDEKLKTWKELFNKNPIEVSFWSLYYLPWFLCRCVSDFCQGFYQGARDEWRRMKK